ncbi:c-type cytochrome [Gemmobacter caeruleus]|uniref:c-type cytochrome n=1 Tax=Gemmobacter caeruleus TaxID=2595004 RepID=UPI0011F01DBE|nr:cytochrome c [Gemmobacter caeruleus]
MKQTLLPALVALAVSAVPGHAMNTATSPRANYVLHCSGCHGMQGLGTVEGGIPGFPNSVGPIVSIESGRDYVMHVPGVVANNMTDAQIAEVMNYILDQWSDGSGHFTEAEVTRRRAAPIGDVVRYRRVVVEELRRAGIEIAEYPWP